MAEAKGKVVVMQPGEGKSWWQPMPANGFAAPKLVPADTGHDGLSMGYQTVSLGGRIRPHSHGDQVELQICFKGKGHVMVDGERHELEPGTACFLGENVIHEIVNDGDGDLTMLWVISPSGLEDFFEAIGRERKAGDAAPEPFERPEDVVAVERAMGMENTRRDG